MTALAIEQLEFPLTAFHAGHFREATRSKPEPVMVDDSPVMARIWVIEGRKRVQRMWRVDRLRELNGRVWGWWHVKGGNK